MSATVRTAKKLLLGREIAHMIEQAGISQAETAKLIETSQSRIALLINGGGSISPGDLVMLAGKLGFDDEGYQEALRELRRDNHKRGFWSTGHNRAYAEDLRLLVDLEKHAGQIRAAQVEVVPGLLQCESYVRAQHSDQPETGEVSLEDRIKARLARQDILDKPEPPVVQFVLSESCVRRVWGDAEVMREQIDHLIKLSQRPNVMLQVMPFEQSPGQRSPIASPFTMIHVPSPGAAGPLELVYIEGEGEIRYLDDKKALAAHEAAWARVSNAALRFGETRKFLKSVLQDFRK
ncbi:Helix-turn-helix [Saccharopolyspora antimicrobica]|uniref:Helix-turn-helix n=1 Tax=Saccharopolyspora antimicrobica TaxID=455193 RepID=A0A1I4VKH3_9PSEU|nr:helix-turn-helix transcriptional regulator [Saccharopolyspora antimicrobica]RKT86357.1 helix-turn-helix protein [Saccharopolyspora antimicrobica]SFN01742.1 Helix-turn-helix [Saccharopolyspora antimicrobica]